MNDQPNNAAKSKLQAAVALLGGLVSPILVVYLFVHTNTPPATSSTEAPAADAQIEERIKPVASVQVEDPNAPAPAANVSMSAEDIVKNSCAACHATGAMNAPKIGDKSAWGPRIAQGYDTLVEHAIKGIRMMPPKGGNSSLSDEDVGKAVALMANDSGAQFTPPGK